MTHERLTRVPDVARLTQLKVLVFRQNRITTIEGLSGLTRLEELDLYDNLIEDIAGLDQLTSLVFVGRGARAPSWWLCRPCIQPCPAWSAQRTRRCHNSRLDLSFNRIRRIANLDKLVNLKELYLISNKISVIEGPAGCVLSFHWPGRLADADSVTHQVTACRGGGGGGATPGGSDHGRRCARDLTGWLRRGQRSPPRAGH